MYSKEYILNNNIAFHCSTYEHANELLMILHNYGIKWTSNNSLLFEHNWIVYKENTCYVFYKGEDKRLFYCDILSSAINDCEIIKFENYKIDRVKDLIKETFLNVH